MAHLYEHDPHGKEFEFVIADSGSSHGIPGVRFMTNPTGCLVSDEEIPALISALQNYMSRRANQITKDASGS
jgi:hypothetical protein